MGYLARTLGSIPVERPQAKSTIVAGSSMAQRVRGPNEVQAKLVTNDTMSAVTTNQP